MSAVDFQTKYSSAMESMLKTAVAETTKLFETMVEDLKAEISQMKKENEDLKTRCSQLEKARNQATVCSRESEAPPGPGHSSKHDRAVQCDLAPFRTVLVERCQPLRHSSVCTQEQESACDQTEYRQCLQDHTYGERTTHIKQEVDLSDECPEHSNLKQEKAQSTGVCGDKAGSPQACACGTDNKGPEEIGVLSLSQKEQEIQQDLELPCLENDRGLQGALNHSSELEPSLSTSPAAVKNSGDVSEVTPKISETQQDISTENHLFVVAQRPLQVEQCVDVQSAEQHLAEPTPFIGDENVKSAVADGGARPPIESVVKGRRGRPPKKSKRVQRVKETGSQSVSEAALSEGCFSKKDKLSESQQLSVHMEGPIQAPTTGGSSATDTLNTQPVVSREHCTSATLQDAMLLVEAMNQSTADSMASSPQRTPVQYSSPMGTSETVTEVLNETCKSAGNLPVTELSAATQPSTEQSSAASAANGAQAHIKGAMSKLLMVTPSSTSTSLVALSTVAVQTHVQSLQQNPPRMKQPVSRKIITIPTSISSLTHHKVAALSQSKHPTFMSVVSARTNSTQPSLSPVSQKTIYIMSTKSLPKAPSQLKATSTDLLSETLPQPKIKIIVPKRSLAVSSRNTQPQTVVSTDHASAKAAAPVAVSPPQVLRIFVDAQTVSDKVATISSKDKDKPSDNLTELKQTTFVSEPMNVSPDMSSNLNKSVDPTPASEPLVARVAFEQKHSVVRLSRIPFTLSTQESVFVSRMSINASSESADGFSEMKSTGCVNREADDSSSCVAPSETLKLSTDISPTSKETSDALCRNTSRVSEEQNDNREKTSPAPGNCTVLEEESPDSGQSTSPKVAAAVFDKSVSAVNTTGPPADTIGEATSNSDDKVSSVEVQDCPLPNDPPIEEKQSAVLMHQASITTEETSDCHSQLSTFQFPEEKVSSEESVTAAASCAETSSSNKESSRRISFMTQLQNHLKAHLKAKAAEANEEPCNETKKQRSENDAPSIENTTREPVLLGLKDIIPPKKTANDPPSVNPRRSGSSKAGVGSKKSAPTSVTSGLFMSTRKSTSGCTITDSMQQNASPEETKSTKVSPRTNCPLLRQRRSTSVKESTSAKKSKSTSVSCRRSSSAKQRGSPKEMRSTPVRPRRISSTRDGTSPKNVACHKSMKTSSMSPTRTKSRRDSPSPSKSAFNPRTSTSSKDANTPEATTNESFCRRKCTNPKDGSIKRVKIDSNSFSPGSRWPKLSKDEVSPTKTRESPPTKKSRLSEEVADPKNNFGVADANSMDKMKKSSKCKMLNGDKTSESVENNVSNEAVRKCITKGVWTPPRVLVSKMPAAGEKEEPSSPSSLDAPLVFPPSVTLLPIPVKAPPVVSPLQPLSVIGKHLLKNQCGECGRVLSSVAALESHVRLHAGRRPFSCTLCGKRFPDSKGLKRHGRVHRNGRIHMCPHCGKGFVYRFGLSKHLMMVHRKIKPFICQICNKGFFTKRDVEAHIRMHTGEKPFHCNLCEKKFARRVELNVHLRWHNGEKRHWCPFCGKGFLDLNNLKRHKYTHTGEKPHSCPHCTKKFTQSGHLKKHVKNVHKMPDA